MVTSQIKSKQQIMKKALFTIVLFLSVYSMFSQEEFPFVKEGAVWSEFHFAISTPETNNKYGMFGDTIIQDTLYKKVYVWNDNTLDINIAVQNIHGYVRESNNKVFFRRQFDNSLSEVRKLYDSNWEEGDSIGTFNDDLGTPFRVLKLGEDSILINGQYRRQSYFYGSNEIDLSDTFLITKYIDGIGSAKELFLSPQSPNIFNSSQNLICYHENGVQFFMNPGFQSCFIPTTRTTQIIGNTKFEIFPNPAIESFFIKNEQGKESFYHLEILNMRGEIVLEKLQYIHSEEVVELSISSLVSGIYFLKISNDQVFSVKKIMIQR